MVFILTIWQQKTSEKWWIRWDCEFPGWLGKKNFPTRQLLGLAQFRLKWNELLLWSFFKKFSATWSQEVRDYKLFWQCKLLAVSYHWKNESCLLTNFTRMAIGDVIDFVHKLVTQWILSLWHCLHLITNTYSLIHGRKW